MTELTMNSEAEVIQVFNAAKVIKDSVPHSFTYLMIREGILSRNYNKWWMEEVVRRLEMFPTLPLSPKEMLFYCYPGKIQCSNPMCDNSIFKNKPSFVQNDSVLQTEPKESKEVGSPQSHSMMAPLIAEPKE